MKKIILSLSLMIALISCNKENTAPCIQAKAAYEKQQTEIKTAYENFAIDPSEHNSFQISNASQGLQQTTDNYNCQCN
jgi:hypothetical protein